MATGGRAGNAIRSRGRHHARRFSGARTPLLAGVLQPGEDGEPPHLRTILPLSLRLGLTINNNFQEGQEAQLAAAIIANDAGISLVAWERDHIPDIAANIPVVSGVVVPTVWPGNRFDLIWCFTLAAGDAPAYHFAALPELLLSGEAPA